MSKRKDLLKGIHAIELAIENGMQLQKVMVQKGINTDQTGKLLSLIRRQEVNVQYVPKERLNRFGQNHQGIVAFVSPVTFQSVEEIVTSAFEKGESPFMLYLDSITDVRNMGAIARSAWFLGVHALIVPSKFSADMNEDTIKASAGALLSIPVCKTSSGTKTIEYLKSCGLRIVCASEKADTLIYKEDFNHPVCLVMGAEDRGIHPDILRISDQWVKIPGMRNFDSLNVSVAAGIACYEIAKQRNQITAKDA